MSLRRTTLLVCSVAACASPRPAPPAAAGPSRPPGVAAAPAAPAAPALDPPRPQLRLPRNFTPTSYRARLALDPARDRFTGAIEIDGEVRERSRGFWLHGRGLSVTSAKLTHGNQSVRVDAAQVGDDLLSLHPADPVDPGRVTIAIEYTGAFDPDSLSGAFVHAYEDVRYIQTQFEAISARLVFPCVDEPDSKVPWQLTLDVPRDLVALANTTQTGETALDGTTKRVSFAPTRPLPSYLIAFSVGPFELVDAGKTRAGTPIRIVAFQGHARDAQWAAETSARIVQLLEDYFGIPYPYDKLDQIARPTPGGGAMENAGLITYGARLILRDPAKITATERFGWVDVAAHELAHQWFGDLVTTAWWDDIWLNEGFASWMASKIVGQFEPAWGGELLDAQIREIALRSDSAVSARRVRQPITSPGDIFLAFDAITYEKGASVLAMFEHAIGPDKFRDGVRAYLARHRFGSATSADFAAAISRVAGRDVAPAFGSFLDQAGAPVVHGELHCEAGQPPKLALSQHRYLPPGSAAPGETRPWQIPVCVAFDNAGARGETCTELKTASAELALGARTCPAWVFANAGGHGYYRSSQPAAALTALGDRGWKQLTPGERILFYDDVSALALTGEVDIALELSLVPRMLAEHNAAAVLQAIATAARLRRLAPVEQRGRVDAWVRKVFGPTARALSWTPRPHDDLDTERERHELVALVADAGDPALRAAAVGLAKHWHTLSSGVRSSVLEIAADADRATFQRLLAAVPTEPDLELRGDLLHAVSLVRDEAELRAALALILDPRLEPSSLSPLIYGGRNPEQHRIVERYLREHVAEAIARFPDRGQGGPLALVGAFLRACDPAVRDDAAAFVREHFGKVSGAERAIARGLESFDQCVAARELLAPKITAWLAAGAR